MALAGGAMAVAMVAATSAATPVPECTPDANNVRSCSARRTGAFYRCAA